MSGNWVKTGLEFHALTDHLSDTAFRLLHASWTHSNSLLLDGRVPARDLGLFARNVRGDVDQAVAELVEDGWWQEIEISDRPGWDVLVKCGRWQRTRDQVLAEQEANRLRVSDHRAKKCADGQHDRNCPAATCPVKIEARKSRDSSPPLTATTRPTDRPTGNAITHPDVTALRGSRACCNEPDLTTWGSATVCRNCGTRAAG